MFVFSFCSLTWISFSLPLAITEQFHSPRNQRVSKSLSLFQVFFEFGCVVQSIRDLRSINYVSIRKLSYKITTSQPHEWKCTKYEEELEFQLKSKFEYRVWFETKENKLKQRKEKYSMCSNSTNRGSSSFKNDESCGGVCTKEMKSLH